MRLTWTKFVCDGCGKEQEADNTPLLDKRLEGWVRVNMDRIYETTATDSHGHDFFGELCPDCVAKTGVKLKERKKKS